MRIDEAKGTIDLAGWNDAVTISLFLKEYLEPLQILEPVILPVHSTFDSKCVLATQCNDSQLLRSYLRSILADLEPDSRSLFINLIKVLAAILSNEAMNKYLWCDSPIVPRHPSWPWN